MVWIKERMNQARIHRNQIQNQDEFAIPAHNSQKGTKSGIHSTTHTYDFSQTLILLAAGFVSGAVIVILLWSSNLIEFDRGAASDPFQDTVAVHAQQPIEPQTGHANTESTPGEPGDEAQTHTASPLELLPPPAAGKTSPLANTETIHADVATSTVLQTASIQPTSGTEIQPAESMKNSGAWVINLASFRQKADAEHFAKQADSKDVAVEMIQATVKGKEYWRVQVTGFSSSVEAKAKAAEIQEQLELKDFWISQR